MAKYSGNLALDTGGAPARRARHIPRSRRVVTPLYPDAVQSRTAHHAHAVRKNVTRARVTACIWTLVGVVAFFSIFGTLLYRQSRIIAAQFQNTEMEIQTKELRQDRVLLEEEVMKDLDLGELRLQAIRRLGMQEPGSNKIITTDIVTSDLVIVNTAGISSDAQQDTLRQLETILGNLEGFFKKIR